MEHRRKIKRIIFNLLGKAPFFGHILASTLWSFEEELPAPAGMIIRESLTIIVNPKIFFELTDFDQKFTLVHEILHFLFKHPMRAKDVGMDRSHTINNIAMDLAVNSYLETCSFRPPGWVCHPSQFDLECNRSYEWYLKNLPTKKLKITIKGSGKGSSVKGKGEKGTEIEIEVPEHWWKQEVSEVEAQALAQRLFENAEKSAGTTPAGLLRDLYKTPAEVDWRDRFITYAQSSEQSEDWMFSKRHTSRRYNYPPGTKHEYQGELHVFVDTSGSMSAREIGACFSIIDKLKLMGYVIYVHEFDAAPQQTYIYQGIPPKVKGGGGTMVRESLKQAKEEFPALVQAIVLTDGGIFDLSGAMPEGYTSIMLVLTENCRCKFPDWVSTLKMKLPKE
jgi:predicted metal-dependent peptidase